MSRSSSGGELRIRRDAGEAAREAAHLLARTGAEAISRRGFASIALSGGGTPAAMYRFIAANAGRSPLSELGWNRCLWFWGDERMVGPEDSESNYALARRELLSKVPVSPEKIHRIPGESESAEEAARTYARVLREALPAGESGFPVLDLVYLGLGTDGHTASLFPGSSILREEREAVAATWVEKLDAWRVSLTTGTINAARLVVFLVCGEEKASIVREVLEGSNLPDRHPARAIAPAGGNLIWILDEAAASRLERRP